MSYVQTLADLEALFGEVGEASRRKEVATLHPVYRAWIERSPFAVLATSGPDGLDTSPRGDPAPLVRIQDEKTLLLPERRGNNRADGLRETVRVNGTARICVEPALLAGFSMQGQPPKCVIEVTVQAVFFQCGRALLRSSLWDPPDDRPDVPSPGQMLEALTSRDIDGRAYDQALPLRQAGSLY
jgi:predicted pyridoxine 5'-phosphate oxidase superfamily flavin-nucleotide-binding protein